MMMRQKNRIHSKPTIMIIQVLMLVFTVVITRSHGTNGSFVLPQSEGNNNKRIGSTSLSTTFVRITTTVPSLSLYRKSNIILRREEVVSALPRFSTLTVKLSPFDLDGFSIEDNTSVPDALPVFSSLQLIADIDWVELSRNIGIGLVSFALFIVGILYLFANVLMPKAAEELEKSLREANPELWAEYESKLQPGETLATRPDLIQELGTKLQQIQLEQYNAWQAEVEASAQAMNAEKRQMNQRLESSPTTNTSSSNKVVDVEVVKEDTDKK